MVHTMRLAAALLTLAAAVPAYAGPSARVLYERALEKEKAARDQLERDSTSRPALATGRIAIAGYERVVRTYPRSGYCDNALWQAAELSAILWSTFGEDADRRRAARLHTMLTREYPTSPFVSRSRTAARRLNAATRAPASARAPSAPAPAPARAEAPPAGPAPPADGVALVRDIRRVVLPDAIRVIVELDREVPFQQDRIADPDRVFVDLRRARVTSDVRLPQAFDEGYVRQIRVGQHPDDTVRVVLDVDGAARHSVFALYSPYRLVIDCERRPSPQVMLPREPELVPAPGEEATATNGVIQEAAAAPTPAEAAPVEAVAPLARREQPPPLPTGPPSANLKGRFSLSRQLGLGVARIVIDPGHGGRDPGARTRGLTEADLVLDVALRLEKLLTNQPGFEVVLTRRTDAYIPLEERTAVANRQDADLFLSIHANASRNRKASGVETYFLNFATNRQAEEVAARENAASGQTMHRLPDIVKAITLNNKLDESRDFATFVQQSLVQRLRGANRDVRDLGVKQAPFVVLIGAGMPSILAEISFLTHAKEGQLLKTPAYRQRIAEALLAGVLRYQKSLKSVSAVAQR